MSKGPIMVRVDAESDLWLPAHILLKKARDGAKAMTDELMARQRPLVGKMTIRQLDKLQSNDKVQGVVTIAPTKPKQPFLFIPSLGVLTKAEVVDIVGRIREGGYGKGPEFKAPQGKEWETDVKNAVDDLVIKTEKKKKGRTGLW